ncbi:hypothetical protein BRC81_08090 [Halobacteriales archaeon QS_1_68_20]|nr:MAG: hypothetical protein BRC81_08090 [Halobacteriales archaeon QS_1_68_20]
MTTQPEQRTSPPVLIYDADCSLCQELAYKVRVASDSTIDLVALSEPEAERLLAEHYPDGWDEDFYLVEAGRCHKGPKALPRIARHVGLRSFAALVGDYSSYKLQSRKCDHDHDHDEADHDVTAEANVQSTNRRTVMSSMGAAAVPLLYPTSKLSGLDSPLSQSPPEDITVNVATVEPDGDGGFTVDVSEHPEALRRSRPDPKGTPHVGMEDVDEQELHSGSLDAGGSVRIRRQDKRAFVKEPDAVSPQVEQALGRRDEARIYSIQVDHDRFGIGVNLSHGSMVTDAGPTEGASMSTRINHDIAEPVVDFVTYRNVDAGDLDRHLDAYAAGIGALSEYHAEDGKQRLADVYRDVVENKTELRDHVSGTLDDDLRPVENHVAISGIPDFLQYVETPRAAEQAYFHADHEHSAVASNVVSGMSCGCACCCNCCCDCGCGCGCGLCGCTCGCGCCCGCGCSCGCGCCWTDVCG